MTKKAPNSKFLKFLKAVRREAADERNFVRKAMNWSLRQIGKRNLELNRAAIITAKKIQKMDSKGARWIASDALRELTSAAVDKRLRERVKAGSFPLDCATDWFCFSFRGHFPVQRGVEGFSQKINFNSLWIIVVVIYYAMVR